METEEELLRYLSVAGEKQERCLQELKKLKRAIARRERKELWEEYEELLKRKETALAVIREKTEALGHEEPEWEELSEGVRMAYVLSSFSRNRELDAREKLYHLTEDKKALEKAREELKRTLEDIHAFEEKTGIPREEDRMIETEETELSELKRKEREAESETKILAEVIAETKKKLEDLRERDGRSEEN